MSQINVLYNNQDKLSQFNVFYSVIRIRFQNHIFLLPAAPVIMVSFPLLKNYNFYSFVSVFLFTEPLLL